MQLFPWYELHGDRGTSTSDWDCSTVQVRGVLLHGRAVTASISCVQGCYLVGHLHEEVLVEGWHKLTLKDVETTFGAIEDRSRDYGNIMWNPYALDRLLTAARRADAHVSLG